MFSCFSKKIISSMFWVILMFSCSSKKIFLDVLGSGCFVVLEKNYF